MNAYNESWTTRTSRFPAAACALLASTVVMSSVLWLFLSAGNAVPTGSTQMAQRQGTTHAVEHTGRSLASNASAMVKL